MTGGNEVILLHEDNATTVGTHSVVRGHSPKNPVKDHSLSRVGIWPTNYLWVSSQSTINIFFFFSQVTHTTSAQLLDKRLYIIFINFCIELNVVRIDTYRIRYTLAAYCLHRWFLPFTDRPSLYYTPTGLSPVSFHPRSPLWFRSSLTLSRVDLTDPDKIPRGVLGLLFPKTQRLILLS